MKQDCVAAVVQLNSTDDTCANLDAAEQGIVQAAEAGAQLIVLPELFTCLGNWPKLVESAECVPGPTSERFAQLAARHEVTLVAGSWAESDPESGKVKNTCQVFLPDGSLAAVYRKLHLFDVEIPGRAVYRESQWLAAGSEVVVCDLPYGRLGLAICYDLRFGELFQRLSDAGCDIIALPAAFTRTTGRDHWEVLLRARAIEHQVYVLASNQCGAHGNEFFSYGHSMIIDPWGNILARVGESAGIALATLRADWLQEVRQRIPARVHRRPLPAAAPSIAR